MFKLQKVWPVKAFIVTSLFILSTLTAVAATNTYIKYTANKIQTSPDGETSTLNGNVKIFVGKHIQIFANNALVTFTHDHPRVVTNIKIMGSGTFIKGGFSTQFTDGNFNPTTRQLTAEKMKTLS